VSTTRFEKVATPELTDSVAVPEVKPDCGLPDLMDIVMVPVFSVVTTFPFASSTDTATFGMELPAVPGPGVSGVKTILLGVLALTVRVKLAALLVPKALVAETVKFVVPTTLVVPLMTPVVELKLKPLGRAVPP